MRATPAFALALWACSDPSFDVSIRYATLGLDPASRDLPAQVASVTVTVIDAEAAAADLDKAEAECADVALGRVSAGVLEGARRAAVSAAADALEGARVSGVPRLGPKLVLVEARGADGRRVGAGCKEQGDVEGDALVEVEVRAAARARVFSREPASDDPSSVRVVVTAAWDDALPLAGRAVVAELHSADGLQRKDAGATGALGTFETEAFTRPERPGPAQTVVRVEWADEPLRVPAFVQWPAIPIALETTTGPGPALDHLSLGAAVTGVGRGWTTGRLAGSAVDVWAAAAIQQEGGAEQLMVAYYRPNFGRLGAFTVEVPGVRAHAFWNGELVTLLPENRWAKFDPGAETMVAITPVSTVAGAPAATELHVVPGCGGAPGMLVRHAPGGAYTGYSAPNVPDSGVFAEVATHLNNQQHTVVGVGCTTRSDGTDTPVVVSFGPTQGLVAWLDGERVDLPAVGAITSFHTEDDGWQAGAVEATLAGPRVRSYALTSLPFLAGTLTGFVPSDLVDSELGSIPTSVAVAELDCRTGLDVVATIPTASGPRLQVNLAVDAAGAPLTSLTPTLFGGRGATGAIVRAERVDGDSEPELVVLSDAGLEIRRVDESEEDGCAQ